MNHTNYIKGMTLIETLTYIALLSIMMIGILSSINSLISMENNEDRMKENNTYLLKQYH